MIPTMGRMVRVTWPDGVQSPAVITRTKQDLNEESWEANIAPHRGAIQDRWGNSPVKHLRDMDIDVQVFGLVSAYPLFNVPFSPEPKPGHWNWPPR